MLSQETKNTHKELERQVLATQPRASLRTIQDILAKNNNPLDLAYISRLREKIKTERIKRYDVARVNTRIAEMQDNIEKLIEKLWEIILDDSVHLTGNYNIGEPKVSVSQKIKAAVAIIKAEKDLLDAQMDAGVFERKLGTFETNFNVKLEDSQRLKIINALKNYGVLEVPCKEISNGDNPTSKV